MGSTNVSADVAPALRDVHRLFDGGVPAAYLKQAVLQGVLAEEHSEKHAHLIIPAESRGRVSRGAGACWPPHTGLQPTVR